MTRRSLARIGRRRSLLGDGFVGMMRASAGALTLGAAGAAATLGLGALEARFPLVRRVDVPVRARTGLKELTILHISDLHLFPGQQFILDFLEKVARDEHFDLVISTGDNLDGAHGVELLKRGLEPLLDRPGAFVLGSHDYYVHDSKLWSAYLDPQHYKKAAIHLDSASPNLPWVDAVEFMSSAGWHDLSNQTATIGLGRRAEISLLGVDDPHILRDRMPEPEPSWVTPGSLRLAVTHAPYRRVLNQFVDFGSDLVLAGHTHGGQIRLPGIGALVNNCDIPRRFSRGLHAWHEDDYDGSGSGKASWLNVSAGLGTSPYAPVRLFCRPEVSLLRVCPFG